MKDIKIYTEYIKLCDLLKFAGVCDTGGSAKIFINEGLVKVDGEICRIKGKKLRGGETVEFNGNILKVVNNESDQADDR